MIYHPEMRWKLHEKMGFLGNDVHCFNDEWVFLFRGLAQFHEPGIEGVDNQGALLFIPLLWIVAFFVIAVINVYTAVRGIKIEKSRTIDLLAVFHLSGLSPKAKIGRIAFLAVCGFLVVFGYCLFAQDTIWAVSYALSGGVLLVFLYAWAAASKHSNKGKAGAS